MKYWQKENWKTASKSNIPHLYLYTWLRVSFWFILIVNSIIMLFIIKENSFFDNLIVKEKIFCIEMAILGLIVIGTPFSPRKVDRTLLMAVVDVMTVGALLFLYVFGNPWIIITYIIEITIIIYLGVKIDRDNRVVDNNRIVLWWKQKERERSERQLQRFLDKHGIKRAEKVNLTEEQKLKKMSKKQRKEYKQKKNK